MFQSSVDMDKKLQKQQEVYKRIQLLGTGSYGKAYLVKQISTEHLYVIKQILIADMTPQQQQNALRQAKILQALSHPNIIKFKEVYRTSKMRLNIVMEYADEGDLSMRIKQAKKENKYFQENLILDWFTQICLGIKHIHDRKIIHRDLKAQNIFLTSDKIAKIGDFGVSRVLQKTVMNARTMVGSPYYLSPQIIQNKPYSFQTDIWSLGALLYQMCALTPPFVANNLQFLALKIVKGAYGQIPNHYSYDLKSLIKSMLTIDSNRRPNINKILTSKVISKRISGFLTQSKRMDEFSHTVIHNRNIFQNQLAKLNPPKTQQKSLLPPPNLINIERDMENKSQICVSNVNFDVFTETKSRPFTPLICQNRKGPNNFFNNQKRLSTKNLQQYNGSKNINFNDLIKIKPSPLEQKVKLPKVNTNPNLFDRKQSQINIKKVESQIMPPQKTEKQIQSTAFAKKRSSKIESPVNEAKKQLQIQNQEQKKDTVVGKWNKPPKTLQRIESVRERIPSKKQDNQKVQENQVLQDDKVEIKVIEVQKLKKAEQNPPKTVKRSESYKKIVQQTKKNPIAVTKKPAQKAKEKKVETLNKKIPKKQPANSTVPLMQIVSEEVKKKAMEEKDKKKKVSRSTSKNQKNQKKPLQKKTYVPPHRINSASNHIKKLPVLPKEVKKPNVQVFEKLSQPPRLQFQIHKDEFQSPNKNDSQPEKEEKQPDDQKTQDLYSHEEFQEYEQDGDQLEIDSKKNSDKECEQDDEESLSSKGSLNFSETYQPPHVQNENYNKMLDELEIIKDMIAHANGVIDTLPVFGDQYHEGHDLLQLSQTLPPEVIRQDDSDLESIINDNHPPVQQVGQVQLINQESNKPISEHLINENNLSVCSNSSQSSKTQQTTNLNILSNQEHLETLKMNLEELFGENNIIFIHKFLTQIVEKEGLDFNQKDVQNMIIFQQPEINATLLKKYFRLIVTVVIMQQQQNFAGS